MHKHTLTSLRCYLLCIVYCIRTAHKKFGSAEGWHGKLATIKYAKHITVPANLHFTLLQIYNVVY